MISPELRELLENTPVLSEQDVKELGDAIADFFEGERNEGEGDMKKEEVIESFCLLSTTVGEFLGLGAECFCGAEEMEGKVDGDVIKFIHKAVSEKVAREGRLERKLERNEE